MQESRALSSSGQRGEAHSSTRAPHPPALRAGSAAILVAAAPDCDKHRGTGTLGREGCAGPSPRQLQQGENLLEQRHLFPPRARGAGQAFPLRTQGQHCPTLPSPLCDLSTCLYTSWSLCKAPPHSPTSSRARERRRGQAGPIVGLGS